jgi:dCTP diphosphatase
LWYKTRCSQFTKQDCQLKDINEIKIALRKFASDRDWDQFHSPKNLTMALSVEVAELMEHFQWLTEQQSAELDAKTKAAIIDEIADIQVYLVRLADKLGVDILQAVEQKMQKNEAKYPVDKVKGSAKKYTEYNKDKK